MNEENEEDFEEDFEDEDETEEYPEDFEDEDEDEDEDEEGDSESEDVYVQLIPSEEIESISEAISKLEKAIRESKAKEN